MKDFEVLRLHCMALGILGQVNLPTEGSHRTVTIDHGDEALMKAFRPIHEVSAGTREAKCQRIELWGDGNPVAYYAAFCRNPETRKFERYSWRYMLLNGQLVLHKTFPVTVRDWRD